MSAWSTERLGTAIVGAALGVLGLFIAVETVISIPAGPAYTAVGPRAFPGLIGAGLFLIGVLHLARAITGADQPPGEETHYDWHALGWIVGSLAAQFALLSWIGWIPAAALVFAGVARGFGSRAWMRNALIGLALGAATFGLFSYALGLELPVGEIVGAIRGE